MRAAAREAACLATALALAASLTAPAAAPAHGEEGEALAATPARTLAQQALGLLTQADQPHEAEERLEAALESEEKEGVRLPDVRRAIRALGREDTDRAVALLERALTPEEARPEPSPRPGGGKPRGGGAERDGLGDELTPERGTAEWAGLGVGVAAILAGLGLLAAPRLRGR